MSTFWDHLRSWSLLLLYLWDLEFSESNPWPASIIYGINVGRRSFQNHNKGDTWQNGDSVKYFVVPSLTSPLIKKPRIVVGKSVHFAPPQPLTSLITWAPPRHIVNEHTDLIFVTDITNYIRGEKILMWRNFSFPCMTIVGKLKISPHVEEF